MASDAETLEARGLVKSYGGKRVVDHIDLTVHRREIMGLLGPNGAGKTTTFYMVMGLSRPDEGRILLDGEDISDHPMYLRARKGITYLAQEPSVFRKLTVEENILAILEWLHISKEEMQERLKSLLNELGISHLSKQKASSLSGGERRRLEITRALVMEPRFMLLDEPFAGIDPLALCEINQIIRQLRNRGIGIIISDHNVRETLNICDCAYIINEGRIIESGSPQEIIQSKIAREVYLGNAFNL
ncbi:MAG: LPS export ABC transporter ATP-binding protein [Deltaproteobacteria bacterium HGW-Deltaproteobacteria-21]|jgi:lipopolysaccharide export system ATP-binding protein|nr:MAG: LPS export ABC transporter ATP-binding protein [Deltaproteobacteria bacterium HGW-Deltaproteobacteria-21]